MTSDEEACFLPRCRNGNFRCRFVNENSLRRSEGEGNSRRWFKRRISSGDKHLVSSEDSSKVDMWCWVSSRLPATS